MMAMPERRRYSEAEYLAFELTAETKHEYYQGEILAMVGASYKHNQITANLLVALRQRLRGGPCRPLVNDLRVRVSDAGLYSYPDVLVVCGEPRFTGVQPDTLLNPTVLFEVLSPSTEAFDRGNKFHGYRRLETLQEYLLVSQTVPRIEQFTRLEGGFWRLREVSGLDATLALPSLDCELPLREVYDEVDVAAEPNAG